jgi:hypothetical protein
LDLGLYLYLHYLQVIDKDLFHASKTLEQSGIGSDVKKDKTMATNAEADYHNAVASQLGYEKAWESKRGAGWKAFGDEIQGKVIS